MMTFPSKCFLGGDIVDRKTIYKKYGAFPADENGRFSWCINCGFSDIGPDASYCEICGHSLYNFCTGDDCWHNCEPYARYCEKCGSPTMLLNKELLWQYTKPTSLDFGSIGWLWQSFFDDSAKNIDGVGWYQQILEPVTYNEEDTD